MAPSCCFLLSPYPVPPATTLGPVGRPRAGPGRSRRAGGVLRDTRGRGDTLLHT